MTKSIRAYKEFTTNIKGLPEGEYLTRTGYSDTHAWVVVSKTAKTMTLREVKVARDPEWKPDIEAGGFTGHCANQSEQTWLFDGFGEALTTVRLCNSRYSGSDVMWKSKHHNFIANGAVEFYDYNF